MNKKTIRVVVPYPNHGSIMPKTAASLERLKQCAELQIEIQEVRGSSISVNRNQGITDHSGRVKQTLPDNVDYVLMVDADIAFDPSHVLRLISHDKDIVSGAYQYRSNPNMLVAGHYDNDTALGFVGKDGFLSLRMKGLVEVDWVGAGFCLIKKEVFEKLAYPWYREEIINYKDKDGEDCAIWVGEDVGFCISAKSAGYSIFCDCDCLVEHLMKIEDDQIVTINRKNLSVEEAAVASKQVIGIFSGLVDGFIASLLQVRENQQNIISEVTN